MATNSYLYMCVMVSCVIRVKILNDRDGEPTSETCSLMLTLLNFPEEHLRIS